MPRIASAADAMSLQALSTLSRYLRNSFGVIVQTKAVPRRLVLGVERFFGKANKSLLIKAFLDKASGIDQVCIFHALVNALGRRVSVGVAAVDNLLRTHDQRAHYFAIAVVGSHMHAHLMNEHVFFVTTLDAEGNQIRLTSSRIAGGLNITDF